MLLRSGRQNYFLKVRSVAGIGVFQLGTPAMESACHSTSTELNVIYNTGNMKFSYFFGSQPLPHRPPPPTYPLPQTSLSRMHTKPRPTSKPTITTTILQYPMSAKDTHHCLPAPTCTCCSPAIAYSSPLELCVFARQQPGCSRCNGAGFSARAADVGNYVGPCE